MISHSLQLYKYLPIIQLVFIGAHTQIITHWQFFQQTTLLTSTIITSQMIWTGVFTLWPLFVMLDDVTNVIVNVYILLSLEEAIHNDISWKYFEAFWKWAPLDIYCPNINSIWNSLFVLIISWDFFFFQFLAIHFLICHTLDSQLTFDIKFLDFTMKKSLPVYVLVPKSVSTWNERNWRAWYLDRCLFSFFDCEVSVMIFLSLTRYRQLAVMCVDIYFCHRSFMWVKTVWQSSILISKQIHLSCHLEFINNFTFLMSRASYFTNCSLWIVWVLVWYAIYSSNLSNVSAKIGAFSSLRSNFTRLHRIRYAYWIILDFRMSIVR